MDRSIRPNVSVSIPATGDLGQGLQPALQHASTQQTRLNSGQNSLNLQGFAQKHPVAVVAAGLALTLLGTVTGTALIVTVGNIGIAAYASVPVGLALLAKGSNSGDVDGPIERVSYRPPNLDTVLKQAIDQAFDKLPQRIGHEMSKLPPISATLADRYNTTVQQLEADQSQALKMLSLHTVLSGVKSAADEHWDRPSRKAGQGAINETAKRMILEKLDFYRSGKNLDPLVAVASQLTLSPQSTYGMSQMEYFALNRIAEFFIVESLTPPRKAARAGSKSDFKLIESCTGVERKQAFINTCEVMAKSIDALYTAFDQFVRPEVKGPNQEITAEPNMGRVRDLDQQFSTLSPRTKTRLIKPDKPRPGHLVARQWLLEQKEIFKSRVDRVFDQLPVESRNAFRNVMLRAHVQNAGDLTSAWVQDRAAFTGARHKLEGVRQEVSKGKVADTQQLTNWIKAGLEGLKEVMGDKNLTFLDLCEALDDNRSGTPWKDGRLQEHTEQLANPSMLEKVRPEHRAATLDVLAAYGEKTVKLFNDYGLTIVSGQKYSGLEDTRQPQYEASTSNTPAAPALLKRIYSESRPTWLQFKMGVNQQINTRDVVHLQTISHHLPEQKTIAISDYDTAEVRGIMAHELGHALDGALAGQLNPRQGEERFYFSEEYKDLIEEHKKAAEENSGITVYSQANTTEFFAEAASAYLEMSYGADETFAVPVGPIKSRENLWAKHPVIAQFLDEVLREPNKAIRAANTPLDDSES